MASGALSAFRDCLGSKVIGDIQQLQHVIIVNNKIAVSELLKVLASNKILAVPVVAAEEGDFAPLWPQDKPAKDIVGFVDVRDIISSLMAEIDPQAIQSMKMLQRMRVLEDKGLQFGMKQLKDLPVIGGDGTFLHVSAARVTLLELVGAMVNVSPKAAKQQKTDSATSASDQSGKMHTSDVVHRVALFDSNAKIISVITQTDIIRILIREALTSADIAATPSLEELGLAYKPVHSVTPEVSAFEAMKIMDEQHVSAVAVVNASGTIIGNFSSSEMRSIMAEHFGALALPVCEFLALEHGTEYAGYAGESVEHTPAGQFAKSRDRRMKPLGHEVGQTLIVVKPTTPLLECMQACCNNHIHRVYVVDDDARPVGVVTYSDILRRMLAA